MLQNRIHRAILETLEQRQLLSTGAPGTPDTSFGVDGLATSNPAGLAGASGLIIQANQDAVVTLDDGQLVRYLPDGERDMTFGTNGSVPYPGAANTSLGVQAQIAQQTDGKILVVWEDGTFEVSRYSANGVLDTTFGVAGVASLPTSDAQFGQINLGAMAVDSSGNIYVAGVSASTDFSLASFKSNGALNWFDHSSNSAFSLGGFGTAWGIVSQLNMVIDGNHLFLGGYTGVSSVSTTAVLMAVNLDGSADTSFGNNGTITEHPGTLDAFSGLGVQSNGDLIAVGFSDNSPLGVGPGDGFGSRLTIYRFTPSGQIDPAFGNHGSVLSFDPLGPGTIEGYSGAAGDSVIIESDDSILIGGQVEQSMMAVHYSANGTYLAGNGDPNKPGYPVIASGALAAIGLQGSNILIAGTTGSTLEMMQYTSDFTLNQSFAVDQKQWVAGEPGGVVLGNPGAFLLNSSTGIVTSTMQPSGKVVDLLTGATTLPFSLPVTLARFNTDGTRDLSFTPPGGITGTAIASLANGDLILAGDPTTGVVRLNLNGTLDNTFAANHSITTAVSKVVPLSNGDLLIAAGADIYRLLPNGAIDAQFGFAGVATHSSRSITDMAVAPDGSIITVGNQLVEKFTASGALDTSFNGSGSEILPMANFADSTFQLVPFNGSTSTYADQKVVIDPSGDIYVTGFAGGYEHNDPIVTVPVTAETELLRLTPDGALDTSFGQGGAVLPSPQGLYADIGALTLESDGKVLIAGGTGWNYLQRFDSNGQTDPAFISPYGDFDVDFPMTSVNAMFESPTGAIVLSGTSATRVGYYADSLADLVQFNSGLTITVPITPGVGPSIVAAKLPGAIVSGTRQIGSTTLKLTNTTTAPASGIYTVAIYASSDGAIDSSAIPLAVFKRRVALRASRSLSLARSFGLTALPAGSYTLMAQTTTASGVAISSPSGPAFTVRAQVVDLEPRAIAVFLPAAITQGQHLRHAYAILTIINQGNVPSTGLTTIAVYSSTDGSTAGTQLATQTLRLRLAPGKTFRRRMSLARFSSLSPGEYAILAQVTDSSGTTHALSSTGRYVVS
jgi:uncharacterized delta-60 repeat protein